MKKILFVSLLLGSIMLPAAESADNFTEQRPFKPGATIIKMIRMEPDGRRQVYWKMFICSADGSVRQTPFVQPKKELFRGLKNIVCRHKLITAGIGCALAYRHRVQLGKGIQAINPFAVKVVETQKGEEDQKIQEPRIRSWGEFFKANGEFVKACTWDAQPFGFIDGGKYVTSAVAAAALGYGAYKLAPIVKNAIVGQFADTQPVKQMRTVRRATKHA